MTIQECYAAIGGDYSQAIGRLRKDALVARFIAKFPKDTSYSELKRALSAQDTDAAFQAAHTLKGVAGNLSLSALAKEASEITEMLRNSNLAGALAAFPALSAQYDRTIQGIQAFTGA